MAAKQENSALATIGAPLTLPCGLTLPNRLVKCPMQETLAVAPFYDPPVPTFNNLYAKWAAANYGLIITGQVQVDIRFLSIAGDVVCHPESLEAPHFEQWKAWARVARSHGTPCIVQLAHPGRMSPAGAGNRPSDMPALCPSAVPVALHGADSVLDRYAMGKLLGTPKAMTMAEIDDVVAMFRHAARVAHAAGFDGIQLHAAHGFLLSQFLSPHTNRRTDAYGGSPDKRMALLRRLVDEIRAEFPPPFCLSVKLNSADYMADGQGLQASEGLEQVRWLVQSGKVDFVEISGGNAENATSKLHNSFGTKTLDKAPVRKESTRIREAFFTDFAEQVQALQTPGQPGYVPIQLSGGYRSRVGMADGIESGVTDLIGLGRSAVLEPTLPCKTLLNPAVPDEKAFGMSHIVRGQWFSNAIPIKIVGSGLGIQFFYHNMRRMGRGLASDPNLSIPMMLIKDIIETLRSGITTTVGRLLQGANFYRPAQKLE